MTETGEGPAGKVEAQIRKVPQTVFDIVSENPEEPEIADKVHQAAVQEDAAAQSGPDGERSLRDFDGCAEFPDAERCFNRPPIFDDKGPIRLLQASWNQGEAEDETVREIFGLQQKHEAGGSDQQVVDDRQSAGRDVVTEWDHGTGAVFQAVRATGREVVSASAVS